MNERASTRTAGLPLWLRDIDASLPTTGQYIVHGAIRDLHLLTIEGTPRLTGIHDAIWHTLQRSGFESLLIHSPEGLAVWPNSESAITAARQALGEHADLLMPGTGHEALPQVVHAVTSSPTPVALALDYISQAQPVGEPISEPLHRLMLSSIASVHRGTKHLHIGSRSVALRHPIIWVLDRPGDVPAWMLTGDGVRQVPIPTPDLDMRRSAAEQLAPALPGWPEVDEHTRHATLATFAESTEGLSIRAMVEVVQLARDSDTEVNQIDDSVRAYRVGLTENPWQGDYLRERIRKGEEYLSEQVLGQPRAVRKTLDLLVRSATGLTAAHQRRPGTGPRGVLFFTGPTGVGKTELAKCITRLVFGDENAFVRFDMSEFSSEHSEARLLGSPPGYIGHGGGGELTNALRRRPFTLLLFDEIEKAHDRIMDKFLQILSDGRLTDGSGDTVYFSESIIVFTSNLGATDVDVSDLPEEEQAEAFELTMRESVERHFTEDLKRPEIYGRIGDGNVVVFQPMKREIARRLAAKYLDNVSRRLQEQLSTTLTLLPEVETQIIESVTEDLSKGGRGVGIALESLYVNPLARAVFELGDRKNLTVTGLAHDSDGSPVVTVL